MPGWKARPRSRPSSSPQRRRACRRRCYGGSRPVAKWCRSCRAAAAAAGPAQRPRLRRVGARRGAVRADGGGKGVRAVAVLLILAFAAGCAPSGAPRRWRTAARRRAPRRLPCSLRPNGTSTGAGARGAEGFHAVKRGDTLYSIALEHGHDHRDIALWNSLDDPTKLSVGQLLRVKPPAQPAVIVGSGHAGQPNRVAAAGIGSASRTARCRGLPRQNRSPSRARNPSSKSIRSPSPGR